MNTLTKTLTGNVEKLKCVFWKSQKTKCCFKLGCDQPHRFPMTKMAASHRFRCSGKTVPWKNGMTQREPHRDESAHPH